MSEPTKGPYRVIADKLGAIESLDGVQIAHTDQVKNTGKRSDHDERLANAHLLAASWDMREALRKHHELLIAVVSAIRVESIKEQLPFGLYDQVHSAAIEDGNGARAALAKSRGEAQ